MIDCRGLCIARMLCHFPMREIGGGKKELQVRSTDLFSEHADWEGLIGQFTAEIDKYTNNGLATTLVADFSTTGTTGAGIVGVLEDPQDYTMTPKIGWFVRTVK